MPANSRWDLTETCGILKAYTILSIHSYNLCTRRSFKMFVHLASKQTKVTLFVFSAAVALILQHERAFLLEVLIETKVSLSERR